MNAKKITRFGSFSILLITFVWLFEASAVSPAIASIAADFPGTSTLKMQLISVIPFATSIIFSVVAGFLAERFDKKAIIIIGLLMYGVTGMLPAFATSVDQIILLRLLTGIGVGLILPLPNVMISEYYEGAPRKRMLGLASSVSNVANAINSVVVGLLLAFGWRYCFISFGIVLVIMVVNIFGLPKSPPMSGQPKHMEMHHDGSIKKGSKKIPAAVFVLSLLMVLQWVAYQLNILNMASHILGEKLGAPWMIGLIIAPCGVGPILTGAIFPEINKRLKSYTVPVALLIFAIGYVVLWQSHNLGIIALGNFIQGLGTGILTPYILYATSRSIKPEQYDVSFGVVTASIHLGILAAPFVQVLIGVTTGITELRPLYLVVLCGIIVSMIIAFIYGSTPKSRARARQEQIDINVA
ncbi:MFS transporter [Parasporobacterium paucivorans]|uniref:Predicted arabinose efflux permease, MFS family n=1 Tax=Parasporobacterium paucivorans DSM 15970 TaxID=1122934 RepID=A0A1M6K030_9FIRM|nr:MFS transporter [Parasporobacterium paucivorans]SHJ52280.1 Predicted arabinose efflux permease, MFS family [Parasporobacterium paucivorans DSM 15970]